MNIFTIIGYSFFILLPGCNSNVPKDVVKEAEAVHVIVEDTETLDKDLKH